MLGRSPPFQIAFSPDGALLAVSHTDAMKVDLLDGHSLAPLPGPNFDGLNNGSLGAVTWSRDGTTLYAGGQYLDGDTNPVVAWANAGRGARHALPAGTTTVARLAALPDGRLLVATRDPLLKLFEPDGSPRWTHTSFKVEFRNQYDRMAVSADGTVIDFSFEPSGRSPLRFDLRALKLTEGPPADQQTLPPKQAELAIERRRNDVSPSLNVGDRYETSRSMAIHPNGSGLVLGTDWYLRAFDAKGRQIWQRSTPAPARVVNISADGRLVIVACGDGTIRWHRLDDGRELLALYVRADKQNWVAWTPEGFYGATAGAFGLLQWQVNRGLDAAADTVPINEIQRLRRPDALALVLQELETARALGIADLKAARRDVQSVTRSTKAPGARLHVLTIGISDYGGKARNLRLNFAHRDAQDVASALDNTQGGGLYAEVKPQFLHDGEADRGGIFEALAAMDRNMTSSTGQDLAVVMFSGHGTMIDNQSYLVPHGADNSTTARLKASAIPATEFRSEIEKLAQHGRVLVLLDACRSAGLIGGPSNSLPAAEVLRAVMNARQVTVLTSSSADKVSREDEKWGHGAFTKALLDALSASDDIDTNRDGVISMSELTAYIEKRLAKLTDGDQQLGLDQRFQGDVFVAGL
jgi:Caspase domain/PQQ-like domain